MPLQILVRDYIQ